MNYWATVSYNGCCGFREICFFDESSTDFDPGEEDEGRRIGPCDSFEELLHVAEATLNAGTLLSIWFVKKRKWTGQFEDAYVWEELRQLVQQIPEVVHMGEHHNPNSGNMIDGYYWKVIR